MELCTFVFISRVVGDGAGVEIFGRAHGGESARAVDEDTVEGGAGAGAKRGQPRYPDAVVQTAAKAAGAQRAGPLVGPLHVAFNTHDGAAGLPGVSTSVLGCAVAGWVVRA